METQTYKLEQITINHDKKRKPLSAQQRAGMQGNYRYYGAQSVIDYVNDYLFDGEYLLIAEDGENLKSNKQNIAQIVEGQFWLNNHAHIVQTNDICNIRYLGYWLNAADISGYITGSAQPKLSQGNLNAIEVELPERNIQDKIVDILYTLDKKIEANKAIYRNFFDQANTFFQSWFVEYEPFGGSRPDDWKEGILDDIIEFSNGYAFKSKELLDEPDSERDCYHVFKQGHINRGGGFNITGTKSWYPKDLAKNLQKYVLQKGDVLMAMTDMKDNVAILGNTAVMEIEGEYIVNQRVGLLRPTGIYGIQYPYISLLTNSYDFLKDLRSRANSGVQVNLSSNEIRNSSIFIAPESVNKEFNELVMPLFEAMIVNDIENLRLADLRDELLPKLMSGELDISDLDI